MEIMFFVNWLLAASIHSWLKVDDMDQEISEANWHPECSVLVRDLKVRVYVKKTWWSWRHVAANHTNEFKQLWHDNWFAYPSRDSPTATGEPVANGDVWFPQKVSTLKFSKISEEGGHTPELAGKLLILEYPRPPPELPSSKILEEGGHTPELAGKLLILGYPRGSSSKILEATLKF